MTLTLRRGDRLVIATHNEGKVRELGELFVPLGIECISAQSLGLAEPEETGASFAANARLKAEAAAAGSEVMAIADDSGLEVAALQGAPGIHSARWGGPSKDFGLAMQRVQRELEASGTDDRRANFVCALAVAAPGHATRTFEGKVFGTLVWPPRGTHGFGYDPIFYVPELGRTMAELTAEEKGAISHRGNAIRKLTKELENLLI